MQRLALPILLVLAAIQLACCLSIDSKVNDKPVTRVKKLLQSLTDKLEEELKAEEDAYENYYCWYKSIVDSKTASNAAARSKIDDLNSYIADIEAGRITFTTEQADLNKQIDEQRADLEAFNARRDKEHADYLAAKDEMEQALKALDEAIAVMQEGTSSFVQRNGHHPIRGLMKALELGQNIFSKEDALFMKRVIDGDVPTWDWKKLNRKATFKAKYKARSGEITKTLVAMRNTFAANLAEAEQEEANSKAEYDTLKEQKEKMLAETEGALEAMVKEKGARGISKDQAQQEVDALTTQVADDERFISQVEAAHTAKAAEWEDRKELRHDEISRVSQAQVVLENQYMRRQFSKSGIVSGYSLLQKSETPCHVAHKMDSRAWSVVRSALLAVSDGSPSLRLLARDAAAAPAPASASTSASIALVIESIDKIVARLEAEEEEDLQNKQTYEVQLANTSREAKTASVAMDDYTEDIVRAETKIAEINQAISEQNETIAEMQEQIETMTKNREEETALFLKQKAEDEATLPVLQLAHDLLGNLLSDTVTTTTGGPTEEPPPQPTTTSTAPFLPECFEYGGDYYDMDTEQCTMCPPGKFSLDGHQFACTDCEPGTFAPETGHTTCHACPAGQTSGAAASTCAVAFSQVGTSSTSRYSSFTQLNVSQPSSMSWSDIVPKSKPFALDAKLLLAAAKQPVVVAAGEAPPPPPSTWEEPYGGAKEEKQGIQALIMIIKQDIEKDINSAIANEADAQSEYESQKSSLEGSISAAETAIGNYQQERAGHEQDKTDATNERALKAAALSSIMEEIKGIKPGADYLLVNIQARTKKRQIEMDGLKEAKAILQGADFGAAALIQSVTSGRC